MVMISHLGLENDRLVAEQVEGIDAVLGGHSHDALTRPAEAGNAIVVQAGAQAPLVARLDVTVDLLTRRIAGHSYGLQANTPGNDELPPAPEVQAAIQGIVSRHAPDASTSVGVVRGALDRPAVADLATRAARVVLGANAALVDHETVWESWGPGERTPQDFLDTFKLERQPAGSPGFSSFYLVEVSGSDLDALRQWQSPTWSYSTAGPESHDPGATYTLALQKRGALNPGIYLLRGIDLATPRFGMEAWEVLDRHARQRTEACLYIDADVPLPDCP